VLTLFGIVAIGWCKIHAVAVTLWIPLGTTSSEGRGVSHSQRKTIMKRIIVAILLVCVSTVAGAWCNPSEKEYPDPCDPNARVCKPPNEPPPPTTCAMTAQQQAQYQKQNQSQGQTSQNTNNNASTSTATGGAGGAGGQGGAGGAVKDSGNSAATSASGVKNSGNSAAGVKDSGNGGGATVAIAGDNVAAQARNPVNTAFAGSQTVIVQDNCRAGWGAGAQGVSLALSFSGTQRDENCEILKLNRELVILGHKDVAVELLRGDERVEAAFKRVEAKARHDERGRNVTGYIELHDSWQATTLVSEHGN
jgi:hypothetical protein